MNRQAARNAVEAFLRALGHEPAGELADTPALVAAAWCDELLDGQTHAPEELLRQGAAPAGAGTGLVLLRDLAVYTICPHHLMPAHGHGDVAYLPGDRIAGLGTVARALRAVTHRLVLQERATESMANAVVEGLGARGSLCRLRLTHTCLLARGAREHEARIETLALRGSFESADRELALSALMGGASR